MIVDCLIIGQGICGTFLSWYLRQSGISYAVIDRSVPNSSSKVAAGIINPITGRRLVKTWMIDELIPFINNAYKSIGNELDISAINETMVVDFFTSPQMKETFIKRLSDEDNYLSLSEIDFYKNYVNYHFGAGNIAPAFLINLRELLPAWRNQLLLRNELIEEEFLIEEFTIQPEGIRYKDIQAKKIIFCDGASGYNNPWFGLLPFALNKGEALLVKIPGLPGDIIYKKGMSLVPLYDDIFWIGSSYEWSFTDDQPSQSFINRTTSMLKEFLKIPFTILDHLASVRPATIERRPFVGFHPLHPSIGILNGMGTKGCSLAPYFAKQLVDNIVHGIVIDSEADVQRFDGILKRR